MRGPVSRYALNLPESTDPMYTPCARVLKLEGQLGHGVAAETTRFIMITLQVCGGWVACHLSLRLLLHCTHVLVRRPISTPLLTRDPSLELLPHCNSLAIHSLTVFYSLVQCQRGADEPWAAALLQRMDGCAREWTAQGRLLGAPA